MLKSYRDTLAKTKTKLQRATLNAESTSQTRRQERRSSKRLADEKAEERKTQEDERCAKLSAI